MTDKLRDKKKNYKIKEEEYGHPLHEPYKRDKIKDKHNYLLADDAEEWIDDDTIPF
jgi:hypothetical protein